ncbi:MAG: TetR/AcrR family transcriptional regulator [Candidatus Izemoplasmatales bacterium]|jgi:AcrR family transcriptional regulator|nr:TetR/AcrR family transcriptional regulator [Candidatus Izemoplasmatales bacterium]MDD4988342.1 TetR/AcrR family transcriptional regulator [Candidatus Izemoplasmatales bacterium]
MTDKKKALFTAGKTIFITKGFKETNVADISKKAGFATGTFYNYYPSKDALFMEIYLDENAKLKRKIMKNIDLSADPLQVIQTMMMLNYQGMLANPILKEWYNRDIFNKIEQNYRKHSGLKTTDFLYDVFIDVVRKWQAENRIRTDISPEMIMAIFSALINVETHKDEIGFQYFPNLINHLSEFTMKALMDGPKSQ